MNQDVSDASDKWAFEYLLEAWEALIKNSTHLEEFRPMDKRNLEEIRKRNA